MVRVPNWKSSEAVGRMRPIQSFHDLFGIPESGIVAGRAIGWQADEQCDARP